jgi:2-dehydro-3-deoxy-D-arabinonate dehydratase
MRLAKIRVSSEAPRVAIVDDREAWLLKLDQADGCHCLADVLHARDPIGLARSLIDRQAAAIPLDQLAFLAPIDRQEVWAAGVTYQRSQVARMEESETGASHYDRVYTADRPELFFKSLASKVAGPGEPVRVRSDSRWTVPEPELTLVVSPALKLVGFTIGNDMSARDIEGENPLYLPQAKLYRQSCAIGPCVLVPDHPLDVRNVNIVLRIERDGGEAFRGTTNLSQMARTFEDLIGWLTRENDFPDGVLLLTGTGIVPPDDFTLEDGDVVSIDVTEIGTLTNPVVKSAAGR